MSDAPAAREGAMDATEESTIREPMPVAAFVWVFNAAGARFPGAVFSAVEPAEAWIAKHALTGVLTAYPLDQGVYEWAVADGRFRPKREATPGIVGGFSSAYQEHYHYEDGVRLY